MKAFLSVILICTGVLPGASLAIITSMPVEFLELLPVADSTPAFLLQDQFESTVYAVALEVLRPSGWEQVQSEWHTSTQALSDLEVIHWTGHVKREVLVVSASLRRTAIPYVFLSASLSPPSEEAQVRLRLIPQSQPAPGLDRVLRMTGLIELPNSLPAIESLPTLTVVSGERVETLRMGLGPEESPRWFSHRDERVTAPVLWSAGRALAFAASPFGGVGPDACETLYYQGIWVNNTGPSYWMWTNHDVIVNRNWNGCAQAELIINDTDNVYTLWGKGPTTQNSTWYSARLWTGTYPNVGQVVSPTHGPACFDKISGTGNIWCGVEGDHYLWTVYSGTWKGNTATIWAPISINSNYSIQHDAKAHDTTDATEKFRNVGT
jgi:hypothetical protein